MISGLRFDKILPSSRLPLQLCISTNHHLKYICLNNRTCLHVHSASSRVCMYGPCYPSSQWTGEACGCNGQWVMFLLNGSAVAFSRLSADTMTHQSDWHLDWQSHTHTATYIPLASGGLYSATPEPYWRSAGLKSRSSVCSGFGVRGMAWGWRACHTLHCLW